MKGSMEKRGERSWRFEVDAGTLPNGKRNRPRMTYKVEDDALLKTTKKLQDHLDAALAAFVRKIENGEYKQLEKMTVDEFMENIWKPEYGSKEKNLSPTTYNIYLRHYKNHIKTHFGSDYLGDIKTLKCVKWVNDLEKPEARKDGQNGPLEASTIDYICRVWKNILSRAVDWELIEKSPMDGVDTPQAEMVECDFYEEEEASEAIQALYKEPRRWRLLILGALVGGCRRAELIGLEWKNVTFSDCSITIKNSIPMTRKGKPVEKRPKSKSSERIIALPEWYMEELAQHYNEWQLEREKQIERKRWAGGDREFVFHAGYGKPFYYTYPSEWWKKFVNRHGIKEITFHELRHSYATLLIEDGKPMKAIQKQLGHAKDSTTSIVYAHVTKKLNREVASSFDKFCPRDRGSWGGELGANATFPAEKPLIQANN